MQQKAIEFTWGDHSTKSLEGLTMYDEKVDGPAPFLTNWQAFSRRICRGRQRFQGILHLVLVEGSGHE